MTKKTKAPVAAATTIQYTRKDVLDFLSKVRSKAEAAVMEEGEKTLEVAYSEAIKANPELVSLLGQAEALVDQLKVLGKRVKEIVTSEWGEINSYWHRKSEFLTDSNYPVDFSEEIRDCYTNPTIATVKAENKHNLGKVRESYNSVEREVKLIRSPKRMREYLDGLGFDTSYLDRVKPVKDKVEGALNLFPCKQRGIQAEPEVVKSEEE